MTPTDFGYGGDESGVCGFNGTFEKVANPDALSSS